MLGQEIIIKGTNIRAITNFVGSFCLIIPKDKTVYIELRFCFDQILYTIKPSDEKVEIQLGKEKQKSKRARRNYNKIATKLKSELDSFYNSEAHNKMKFVCN